MVTNLDDLSRYLAVLRSGKGDYSTRIRLAEVIRQAIAADASLKKLLGLTDNELKHLPSWERPTA